MIDQDNPYATLIEANRSLRNLFIPPLLAAQIAPDDQAKRVVAYLAGKGCKTHEALLILSERGYGQDSGILVRSLLNLAINLLWINMELASRVEMYLEYDWIQKQKVDRTLLRRPDLLGVKGRPTLDELQVTRKNIDSEADRVRKKYGYKSGNNWSRRTIKQMAADVGLEETYAFAYTQLSGIDHSDATSSSAYLVNVGNDYRINIGPGYEWLREVLLTAHMMFCLICEVADGVLRLDLAKQLNDHKVTAAALV